MLDEQAHERSELELPLDTTRRPSQQWPVARGASWTQVPNDENSNNYANMFSNDCWKRYPVIDPQTSPWLHTWDCCMAVLLVIVVITLPYETAFLEPKLNGMFVFDRVIDLMFIADMCTQLFLAYPQPRHPERVIKNPRLILKNYMLGWFCVDCISLVPADAFYVFVVSARHWQGQRAEENDLIMLRPFRLIRLLRVGRLVTIVERWRTSFGYSYASMSLCKFAVIVIFSCHWIACLWGAIGYHTDAPNWLSALQASKDEPEELCHNAPRVYLISLYWSIITLTGIGYGDVVPQSTLEYVVVSICATYMATIWAYVIGAVCGIVSTLRPHEISFKRIMDDLNEVMADREMPSDMRCRLRRYFHEARDMTKARIEQNVIDHMSPVLQGEFSLFVHQRWVRKVWYLRDMNREVIVWATRHLTVMVFAPNEEVYRERTLFIVRRGVAALDGRILVNGDIWGEDMLLSNPYLRELKRARSLSYLETLMLHITDLVDIISLFPEARQKLRWAQVRIAILRGVRRIATVLKEMSTREHLDPEDLTDDERMELYAEILQGVNPINDSSDAYVENHWDVQGLVTFPSARRTSTISHRTLSPHDTYGRRECTSPTSPIPRTTSHRSRIGYCSERSGLEGFAELGTSSSSPSNADVRVFAAELRRSITKEFRQVTTELRLEVGALNEKVERLLTRQVGNRHDTQGRAWRAYAGEALNVGLRPLESGITHVGNRARNFTGLIPRRLNSNPEGSLVRRSSRP